MIQNDYLRDYVEELRSFSFTVEYIPGSTNGLADCLSRLSFEQLYEFEQFKEHGVEYFVLMRRVWRKFITVEKRLQYLIAAHGPQHFGYLKRLEELKQVHWPELVNKIKDFFILLPM